MPVTDDTGDVRLLEEPRDQDAELVRRPLTQRREPPAVREPVAVEHADRDVRVADVDG